MTTISIIVPVKHGGYVAAFEAIRQSCFDKNGYEVLLAEGSAPSLQRNLAASRATGDILYFIDDDSMINDENFSICSNVMADEKIAVVGGPSITPATDSSLQQLFGFALASALGSGAVRNRYRAFGESRETTDKELILCNLAIRRSVFIAMGGFDDRLYPNEENELLDRIRMAGFKLMHIPKMNVLRSQRASLKAFIRQMFAYGRGRAQQSLISGSFPFVSFVPLFFTLYLLFSVFFHTNTLFVIPLIVYSGLSVLFAMAAIYTTGRFYMIFLLLIYPLMHCANGIGLLLGLLGGRPLPVCDDAVVIKKIKELGQDFPERH